MTDRFTLLAELGGGGMGVVWKARDEETGSIIALKLMRESYAEDADYVTRFERELELSRRIKSDHVVRILGFGVRERRPYLALEYVDGPSLQHALIQNGPRSWPDARAMLIQIAQGLSDAHAAGIIHRDVKPSNVLIGADGVAKLTDFGIARGLDLSRITATSTMLGTPAYMAPEGPVDIRSDLYSLGAIGYELLAGETPFIGATYQQIILAHVRTPPDLEQLPVDARPIIGWMLAKDAEDRPQNGQELLAVLRGRLMLPGVNTPTIVHATSAVLAGPTQPGPPVPPGPSVSASPHGATLDPLGYYRGVVVPSTPSRFQARNGGRYAPSNSLSRPRVDHVATLMADGRVLITGGRDQAGALSLGEVFDAVSGNISEVANASEARKGHSVTLLANGRVLIVGGGDSRSTFDSTETFDPTSRSFSAGSSLRIARQSHTATLLPNGRVLVIGGSGRESTTPVKEIEEFDTASGTFKAVGELLLPRSGHVATLMIDGRVLITGGLARGRLADKAEAYDPRTQATSYVGRLNTPRRDHTAVALPDGRVLIVGGTNGAQLSSAEVYLPRTVGFTTLGSMREPRSRHTATVLPDGRVLVAGGLGPDGPRSSSELFDPAAPGATAFAPDAPMMIAREGHTATLLGTGAVLVVGGTGMDGAPIASTEVYSQ
jgi:serine/threonine protein kinase